MVSGSMGGRRADAADTECVLTEERPGPVDEQRRRRRAAEAAAAAAEAAAAKAAARASAAIAAAAAAAAAADAAAQRAAAAAAVAEAAVAAERHAVQRAPAGDAFPGSEPVSTTFSPLSKHREPVAAPRHELPPDEAALARAETMTISATPLRDGRAARRRVQEAARRRVQEAVAAVAREANRDPDTEVLTFDDEPDPGVGAEPRWRREALDAGKTNPVSLLLARIRGPAALLASVAGLVVVLVGAAMLSGSRGPATTIVTASAPAATAAPTVPTSAPVDPGAVVDPTSPRAVRYLTALRAAGVPTSASGRSETEAAEAICRELATGADPAELVRALPAVLPTVDGKQAERVVSIAQRDYCS